MVSSFEGQVAVVTGAASGIGKRIAAELSDRGATVVLFDIDAEGLKPVSEEIGGEATVVDCADDAAVQEAIGAAAARHGRLDLLVHCAAVVGPNARKVTEVSVEEFDRVYRANLRSSFLVTKYALLEMQKRDYGRILLFSSIAGKEGNAGMSPYSTTKAGVIGLVKSAGKEFAETGITVNAIAPAVIRTAMVESMAPEQVKYMTDRIPMKRTGTLDEVAELACWIVSPEASFNTAFTFDLTGGRATY